MDQELGVEKILKLEIDQTKKLGKPDHLWTNITILNPNGSMENVKSITSRSLTKLVLGSDSGQLEPVFLPVFEDFGFQNIIMFCDDNGVKNKLSVNPDATKLYQFGKGWFQGSEILGKVAIYFPEENTNSTKIDSVGLMLNLSCCPEAISRVKESCIPIEIPPEDEVLLKVLLTMMGENH
jgi:hypothetical protein